MHYNKFLMADSLSESSVDDSGQGSGRKRKGKKKKEEAEKGEGDTEMEVGEEASTIQQQKGEKNKGRDFYVMELDGGLFLGLSEDEFSRSVSEMSISQVGGTPGFCV